ncbi:class F sortase [Lentzea tibetensis]|uniref:Class F sortase n=1 Tax=Lentzea tibetensis TaxID=2591470 RepID=A0A563F2C4_9PSEU|nr:class F sortase [Lentzea tibetensis]TWP54069.1 class F sortase [Lentzea tibetensis]
MNKVKLVLGAAVVVALAYAVKPHAAAPHAAAPVTVRIPSIGVTSSLEGLSVDKAGALVPPTKASVAGWYSAGVAPGDAGPALIAGHVDSRTGPGVFYRLPELKAGDEVFVDRKDGSHLTFVVGKTYAVEKTAFPTDLVYSPTPVSELRLVTCGGEFDQAAGSYRQNVIVEAVLKS